MSRKTFRVDLFTNERRDQDILRVHVCEDTHTGISAYIFDLTPQEADALQGEIGAALRRTFAGGGKTTFTHEAGKSMDRDPAEDNEEKV